MSILRKIFGSRYEHDERLHNTRDADILVPFFIKHTSPNSVVDVGCGLGTFLHVFKQKGVADVLGIEGKWLDKSKSLLSSKELITANLEEPVFLERKFDLALCLEVAEHLKEDAADQLVETLVSTSDYIIFSAAIPFQGGQNHINEQWSSWWEKKFNSHGYSFYDVIRSEFWDRKDLFYWYKQNMFLIISDKVDHQFKKENKIKDLVHPELYLSRAGKLNKIVTGRHDLPSLLKHLLLGIIKLPLNLFGKK